MVTASPGFAPYTALPFGFIRAMCRMMACSPTISLPSVRASSGAKTRGLGVRVTPLESLQSESTAASATGGSRDECESCMFQKTQSLELVAAVRCAERSSCMLCCAVSGKLHVRVPVYGNRVRIRIASMCGATGTAQTLDENYSGHGCAVFSWTPTQHACARKLRWQDASRVLVRLLARYVPQSWLHVIAGV